MAGEQVDFLNALAALIGVLLLGILEGILLAALIFGPFAACLHMTPHVAFLGKDPGTGQFSDLARHPENEPLADVVVFRPGVSVVSQRRIRTGLRYHPLGNKS